ncbi:unnamed protein product [Caenorhabditis sp. 36 PRJEB53466]|nr:unnamed protein product [Caenorhabditis sp. 36 PRJEB53466]
MGESETRAAFSGDFHTAELLYMPMWGSLAIVTLFFIGVLLTYIISIKKSLRRPVKPILSLIEQRQVLAGARRDNIRLVEENLYLEQERLERLQRRGWINQDEHVVELEPQNQNNNTYKLDLIICKIGITFGQPEQ